MYTVESGWISVWGFPLPVELPTARRISYSKAGTIGVSCEGLWGQTDWYMQPAAYTLTIQHRLVISSTRTSNKAGGSVCNPALLCCVHVHGVFIACTQAWSAARWTVDSLHFNEDCGARRVEARISLLAAVVTVRRQWQLGLCASGMDLH